MLSAAARMVVSGELTLNKKSPRSLIRQFTANWTSAMFSSPVSIKAPSPPRSPESEGLVFVFVRTLIAVTLRTSADSMGVGR